MGFNLITDTTAEPVALAAAKDQIRITTTEEDALIQGMITVARKWCEGYSGKSYMAQTWDIYMDSFPDTPYDVPFPPLNSVTHIKYVDTDGTTTEVGSTEYTYDIYSNPGRIEHVYGYSWPTETLRTVNGVVIRVVAGSTAIGDVPEEYKLAIKLLVGHLYEHREETSIEKTLETIPMGVKSFLDMSRMITLP